MTVSLLYSLCHTINLLSAPISCSLRHISMTAIESNEYHLIGCYIALNGLKWKDDRMSLGTEYQERTDVSSWGLCTLKVEQETWGFWVVSF